MIQEKKIGTVISLGNESSDTKKNDLTLLRSTNKYTVKVSNSNDVTVDLKINGKVLKVENCFKQRTITFTIGGQNTTLTNYYFGSWVDKKLPGLLKFVAFIYYLVIKNFFSFYFLKNNKSQDSDENPVCLHCR